MNAEVRHSFHDQPSLAVEGVDTLRTACRILGRPDVIVVGSQAILVSDDETELPA